MCFVELHWAEDPSFRTNCVFYKYKHWSTRHILQKIQLSGHKCSPAELPSSSAWTLYVVNSILCVCVQCAWNREPVSAPKSPAKSCRSLPFYDLQLLWRQKEVQYVCQHNICTVAVLPYIKIHQLTLSFPKFLFVIDIFRHVHHLHSFT